MTSVVSVLGFVAVPVATSVTGAVVAAYKPAGEKIRGIVQHLAAGLVFAAASLELLPDLVREHSQAGAVIGFDTGVAVMLLLGRLSDHYEEIGGQGAAIGVVEAPPGLVFDEFAETWGRRYPAIVRLWDNAWEEFIPFLDDDTESRRMLCSTNTIESLTPSTGDP